MLYAPLVLRAGGMLGSSVNTPHYTPPWSSPMRVALVLGLMATPALADGSASWEAFRVNVEDLL